MGDLLKSAARVGGKRPAVRTHLPLLAITGCGALRSRCDLVFEKLALRRQRAGYLRQSWRLNLRDRDRWFGADRSTNGDNRRRIVPRSRQYARLASPGQIRGRSVIRRSGATPAR